MASYKPATQPRNEIPHEESSVRTQNLEALTEQQRRTAIVRGCSQGERLIPRFGAAARGPKQTGSFLVAPVCTVLSFM
jgi:hypothetical protein